MSDESTRPRSRLPGRIVSLLLIVGVAVAAYFLPWRDFQETLEAWPAPEPDGPYAVMEGELPTPASVATSDAPLKLFYPDEAQVAVKGGVWPLVLYAPGWRGRAIGNEPLLRNLASYGYVVIAFDDIYHDAAAENETNEEREARRVDAAFTSDSEFDRILRLLDVRVDMQARKAIAVLNWLSEVEGPNSPLPIAVDLSRIGAIGFSFGGSSMIEAMAKDSRIRAAVNLDGYLFGETARSQAPGAYLEFNSSETPMVLPTWLQWIRPRNAYAVRLERLGRAAARQQLDRPDAFLIQIWGSLHDDFTAQLHEPGRWALWRPWRPAVIPAQRVRPVIDGYLLAFLQTYLLDQPHPLIERDPSPFPSVRLTR